MFLLLQKHMEKQTLDTPKKASKNQVQQLQDDMMTLRLREAQTLGELKELKQKVMELETEVPVACCLHHIWVTNPFCSLPSSSSL